MLAVLGVTGVEYLGRTRVDPIIEDYRAIQSKHLALYEEDQEFLSRVPIFETPLNPIQDAGEVLNARVPWTPQPEGQFATRVPADLTEEVIRYKNDWMRHHNRLLRNRNINLSWFSDLKNFDFWDIENNSPQEKLMKEERFVGAEQLPIPDAIELVILGKLRLAVGASENKPLPALQEVRKLAQLLLTAENIHLYTAALSLFDVERRAYQYFVDIEMLKETDWEPIPRNITRRASRAVWAARGYFHYWTEPPVLKRAFLGPRMPIGFCAAINEAAPRELSLRPMFVRRLPFERDMSEALVTIEKVIDRANGNCRLKYFKAMKELKLFSYESNVPRFLTKLPYSRKIFGLRISTLPFIGFEGYGDLKQRD